LALHQQLIAVTKFYIIEDLDEYYHIDRMMMNLKRNGCLESIKGIVVGSMTKMKRQHIPWGKNAFQIVEDITKSTIFRLFIIFLQDTYRTTEH
jgi:muramoyltetrapeptide carboxypeptidase LdcA involved in peptidoglycan recycling